MSVVDAPVRIYTADPLRQLFVRRRAGFRVPIKPTFRFMAKISAQTALAAIETPDPGDRVIRERIIICPGCNCWPNTATCPLNLNNVRGQPPQAVFGMELRRSNPGTGLRMLRILDTFVRNVTRNLNTTNAFRQLSPNTGTDITFSSQTI